jgi:hypothetical protein
MGDVSVDAVVTGVTAVCSIRFFFLFDVCTESLSDADKDPDDRFPEMVLVISWRVEGLRFLVFRGDEGAGLDMADCSRGIGVALVRLSLLNRSDLRCSDRSFELSRGVRGCMITDDRS